MFVITDSPQEANVFFSFPPKWRKINIENFINIYSLLKLLFFPNKLASNEFNEKKESQLDGFKLDFQLENKNLYYFKSGYIDWDYCFIVEDSSASQYNILNKIDFSQEFPFIQKLACVAISGKNFHGTKNRKWISKKGNLHLVLYCSFDNFQFHDYPHFFLVLGIVSIIQALKGIKHLKDKIFIKWVNDIIIQNSKIGGVITRIRTKGKKFEGVVIGIGINVNSKIKASELDINSEEIDFKPGNLSDYLKENDSNNNLFLVFNNILNCFSENLQNIIYKKDYFLKLIYLYKQYSLVIGKEVEIHLGVGNEKYKNPLDTERVEIITDKVVEINNNLELILEKYKNPINSGDLKLRFLK